MSSLVFVRDAQGRPLMPMSAAYARTLIKQGKAQIWPHPAVSVIQLTRVVAEPTLRPVLVGVAMSRHLADVVIVIDQQRGPPSTIHVVVDLRFPPLRWDKRQDQGLSQRRRLPFTHDGALSRPADCVRRLMMVLRTFHTLIPISHFILLPSARKTALTPPHAWWVEHRLAAGVRRLSDTVTVVHHHTHLSGEAPRTLTGHMIDRIIWAPRESPDLIACVPMQQWKLSEHAYHDHRWRALRSPVVVSTLLEPYLRSLGHVCTIRQQRRILTGVIHALKPPDQLMLAVPVRMDDQGIRWQSIPVRSMSSLDVWPATPICLLPLAREANGGHRQ